MKSDQELLLFRLTQNLKPFLLMLVYDWAPLFEKYDITLLGPPLSLD
jgi:hypothetical protein